MAEITDSHVILSLGAGVQSTALALMAAGDDLPPDFRRPSAAIFADTGWEPASVYAHLRWLVQTLGTTLPVEQFAVVQDGLLKSLRLTHTGAQGFFTLAEMAAANIRSLLSAYVGLWSFPAPTEVPTDLRDPDVRLELRRRLAPVQLDLFTHLPVVA